ncbi:hypothetical protein NECID01_1062 [Nematocida sp. AWRm77]|nr:hypothetical protein NECID01_1062 [Nematocida sp. AWRm77]
MHILCSDLNRTWCMRVVLLMCLIAEVFSSTSKILVEEYFRTVSTLGMLKRVRDVVVVKNIGKNKMVFGGMIPQEKRQYVRYSDELGRIHTHVTKDNMHVLGFRHPLHPGEKTSFQIDRVGMSTGQFLPVFPADKCLMYSEECSVFPFWMTAYTTVQSAITTEHAIEIAQESIDQKPAKIRTNYTSMLTLAGAVIFYLFCFKKIKLIG